MATYGSRAGVEAVNSHLIGGYTSSTVPTVSAVGSWLEQGYAALNVALAKAGCAVPISTGAACYDLLVRLNNLYAAACAEQSVNISTAGPGEETRSEKLWRQYKDELGALLTGDLSLAGLTPATTASPRRRVRSLELRRRDGYAKRFDATNSEYASSATDETLILHDALRDDTEGNF